MSRTIRFKQNLVLFLFFLSCILSLAAAGAALGLFSSQEQNRSPVLPPLFAEPSILDFQKVNDGKHEGTVYLTNRSKKKINLLFARSSCSCSVAELPGDTILPGERLPVKCTLSTVGQSGTVGGEILIAYRYFDSGEENVSPMYIPIVLKATVNTES